MSSSFYIFGYETLFWFIMFIGRRDLLYLFWCDLASKHVDDKICIAVNKLSTLFTHLQETFDNFSEIKNTDTTRPVTGFNREGVGGSFPHPD